MMTMQDQQASGTLRTTHKSRIGLQKEISKTVEQNNVPVDSNLIQFADVSTLSFLTLGSLWPPRTIDKEGMSQS